MGISTTVKRILSNNPLATHRRKSMRASVINRDMTFLCPNCIGGILFHDLGLQFQSPTVNLMMTQTDFLKFVLHLDEYLAQEFRFYTDPELTCPCAHLGDITVTFTHFKTEDDALTKWNERAKRIDKDNLFIFIEERDGLTEKDLLALGQIQELHPRGILAFTAHDYPEIPFALKIPKYEAAGEVGNILEKTYINDGREYEKYFDFVKWFNEASGPDYDISPYIKK